MFRRCSQRLKGELQGTMTPPLHISWLKDTGKTLTTASGQEIHVLEFEHTDDAAILTAWAKHFREHYCLDKILDDAREGTGLSRKEYLEQLVFPSKDQAPGPSTRAGDFAEILVADYFEYLQGWRVPRTRYRLKSISNESTKGTDILAFRLAKKTDLEKEIYSPQDILMSVEVKAQFSGKKAKKRLQDAVDDSVKDQYRKALSLNAMKMRLQLDADFPNVKLVERFQNLADRPYKAQFTATAFHCTSNYEDSAVNEVDVDQHPEKKHLSLLLVKGCTMMQLVNQLYKVAANEA
jgi:hypothetical protein